MSSGCIRLLNSDIIDLYSRVDIGTKIVVLPNNDHVAAAGAPLMPRFISPRSKDLHASNAD